MKNIDAYKDEIVTMFKELDVIPCHHIKKLDDYGQCKNCPLRDSDDVIDCDLEKFYQWLVKERKPFTLKRWEYDLLSLYSKEMKFNEWGTLNTLKEKGHFKGITDTTMKMGYILENCEVEEDD